MNNYGIVNITPSTTNQIYNGGYYNSINIGAVTSSIDANITSQNIVNGVNILGVVGSFEGLNTADANATYNDIIIGKTAYVNGVKITGSMNNLGALNITPSTSAQSFSAGYYNSVNISAVTSNIDNNIVPNYILNGINILGVTGNLDPGYLNEIEYADCIDLAEQILGVSYNEETMEDLNDILDSEDDYGGYGADPEIIEDVLDDILGEEESE